MMWKRIVYIPFACIIYPLLWLSTALAFLAWLVLSCAQLLLGYPVSSFNKLLENWY